MLVIDIDKIKELFPGYSPDRASEFHCDSAKEADKIFNIELKKEPKGRNIILMCGGSASGKTEFVDTYIL